MKIQIKNGIGTIIFETEADSQIDAVQKAVNSGAYLSRANLSGANLSRANLSRAYLSGAIGLIPEITCDLHILLDQPGEMISYKLTNDKNFGVFKGGLEYTDDTELLISNANTDPNIECAEGINVATLSWIIKEWKEGYLVKVIHHTAKDIACIPTATDGKYRLSRGRVGTKLENDAITERVKGLIAKMIADYKETNSNLKA